MRSKRGGPPHQELPPVDHHWPRPFGISSASSSSSSTSNCLDSGKTKIREKSQIVSSSSLEINEEEGKYDGEEKEEKERKRKKEEEVRRDKASPSSSKEAPGGSSSSSQSKFCVTNLETNLPRPWSGMVPGPPAPSASWWISSGSHSSSSTHSSTTSGASVGADGEGRGPLKGVNCGGNIGIVTGAGISASAATLSCALGVVGEREDYTGVESGGRYSSGD
jgi:hypothetical protein